MAALMLRGDRTTLRALQDNDLELLRSWRNHPDLFPLHCSSMLVSQIEQRRWYDHYGSRNETVVFMIEDEEQTAIGYTILKNLDHKNGQAEIGLHIAPERQGKGYGKDAFKTLIRYCFEELNLNRVYLQVFSFNQRAARMYEALGFQHEGRLRECYFSQNAYHDILIMGLLRREYQP